MRFSFLSLSLLLFLSCDEELLTNPLDEESADYVEPETTITVTDLDGSTLATSTVTIGFEGNDQVIEYSYNLDSSGYSDWSSATSVTLDYLDEGQHTFSVKSRFASGDEDETPASISFTVDAVTGPALIFYPRRHIISSGSIATIQIKAYEVDSLMSATITLTYDPASLKIVDEVILDENNEIIESVSQGDMFTNTGESVFIYEEASGSLTIHTMFMGGDTPYVSGTGSLAVILVKALVSGSHTLSLDGAQVLKTHTNRSITITETVNGLVVVE